MSVLAWLLAACTWREDSVAEALDTMDGTVTWTVTFDDAAHQAGHTDCQYSRVYAGEEDRSVPWLCPDCDVLYRATVGMTQSDLDCYGQLEAGEPSELEWLGTGQDRWWRNIGENWALFEMGPAQPAEGGIEVSLDTDWEQLDDGTGQRHLSATGDFELASGIGDPWHGASPPDTYTCGWIDRDPPAYEGPWSIEIGALVPDGAFLDRCNEAVRLQQFAGSWLVIELAAMDCGPCQSMAVDEPAFEATSGGSVQVVTLLTHSLAHQTEATERIDIDAWSDSFGLESPVLRDRAWGWYVAGDYFPSTSPFPTTVVVGPDGRVRDLWVGYNGDAPDLSWDRVAADIERGDQGAP